MNEYYRKVSWPKLIRSIWFKVHLYIALTIGFFFVVLGLTGACNVFYIELEELGLPQVRNEADVQPRSLDEIMQTVKAAHPEKKGKWSLLLPNYKKGGQIYFMPARDRIYIPSRIFQRCLAVG